MNPAEGEPTPRAETKQVAEEKHGGQCQNACPVTGYRIWESSRGDLEGMYAQVKRLLEWEALALIAQDSGVGSQEGNDVDMKDVEEQTTWTDSAAQKSSTIEEHWDQRNSRMMRKIIMGQGPWYDEESTVTWKRYMQTEGLCQHICCQYCQSTEKPIVVVTPGRMEQRRLTVCFCTSWWRFTCKHTRANSIELCHMQRRNIRGGFEDR
jgi:hypothetical protein